MVLAPRKLMHAYQKWLRFWPGISVEPFDSNSHLIIKSPFINHIWSLFSMFRNYIFNGKSGRSLPKLINCEFMKPRQVNTLNNIVFVSWTRNIDTETAITLRAPITETRHIQSLTTINLSLSSQTILLRTRAARCVLGKATTHPNPINHWQIPVSQETIKFTQRTLFA